MAIVALTTLGIKYDNKQVDTRFSPIAEPNLFDNNVLIPGITFTGKYQLDNAGQIVVHKAGLGTVGTGAKFSSTDVASEVIIINRDERYNFSREVYGDVEAATSLPVIVNEMEAGMGNIGETWQETVFTKLVAAATAETSTVQLTKATVYDAMIDSRAALIASKAKPQNLVAIVSPLTYANMLKADLIVANASVGTVNQGSVPALGNMTVMEYQGLAADVEYAMYDFNTLSVVPLLEAMRVKDAIDFVGGYAQAHITSGTKVTNEDVARVKKFA